MTEKIFLLDKLKKKIVKNLNDDLSKNATNLVFGKGNPDSKILFIGEAPGEKEDLQGLPFVGSAGKQLDKLLQTINLTIDDIYIANILKYRPPKNRDPTKNEIKEHAPYLLEQIKIIGPKIIVTLGNYSTKFVLGGFNVDNMEEVPGISATRGKPKKLNIKQEISFFVLPIFHPAALLYRPALREITLQDFKKLKAIYKKITN